MTWSPEFIRRLKSVCAIWTGLAVAGSLVAADAIKTNTSAAWLSNAAGSFLMPDFRRSEPAAAEALPAWMELDALATNAAPWADLAAIWRRPDPESSPVEDFTLPIEHYENGRIRAVLHAGKAAVGKAGLIWSWQVMVDLFDPLGASDGRIEAESCLYDRNTQRGYCPAGVLLSRTNVTISGTGMYWVMSSQQMRIMSNLTVRLRPDAGAGNSATNRVLRREGKKLSEHELPRGGSMT